VGKSIYTFAYLYKVIRDISIQNTLRDTHVIIGDDESERDDNTNELYFLNIHNVSDGDLVTILDENKKKIGIFTINSENTEFFFNHECWPSDKPVFTFETQHESFPEELRGIQDGEIIYRVLIELVESHRRDNPTLCPHCKKDIDKEKR
jgi:hypothetical protein